MSKIVDTAIYYGKNGRYTTISSLLFENSNGIEVESVDPEAYGSVPFDTGISIDRSGKEPELVLEGHVGPSGYGTMVVKLPLYDANEYYRFFIEYTNGADIDHLVDTLGEYGWDVIGKEKV